MPSVVLNPIQAPVSSLGDSTQRSVTGSLGPYQLVSHLGSGGMASVYLAERSGAAGFVKPVVLKTVRAGLREDPEMLEMFLDEGWLMAQLSHPNVPQVFELGEADGKYFIAMEYIHGESVAAILRRASSSERRLPILFAIHIMLQLLDALEYLHRLQKPSGEPLNLIHRDVTPSNVVVTFEGSVKLLDFGIARSENRTHQTEIGIRKGKLAFMAPEQWRGEELDERVDIFAAGAILYELVTGFSALTPHDGYSLSDVVSRGLIRPARELRPDVPMALEAILQQALAPDRKARFIHAADFNEQLGQFAASIGMAPGQREVREYMRILFPQTARTAPTPLTVPPPAPPMTGQSVIMIGDSQILRSEDVPDRAMSHLTPVSGIEPLGGFAWKSLRIPAAMLGLVAAGSAALFFHKSPEHPHTPSVLADSVMPREAPVPAPVIAKAAPAPVLAPVVAPVVAKAEPTPAPVVAPVIAKAEPTPAPAVAPVAAKAEPKHPVVAKRPAHVAPSEPRYSAPKTYVSARIGRLQISAATPTPVFENGRQLGTTPVSLDLSEGAHQLWVMKGDIRTPLSITVQANTEAQVFINNANHSAPK